MCMAVREAVSVCVCERVPSRSKSLEPRRGRVGAGEGDGDWDWDWDWGGDGDGDEGWGKWVVVERKRKSGVSSVGSESGSRSGVGWKRVSSSWSAIWWLGIVSVS